MSDHLGRNETSVKAPVVPAVCANCGKPMRIWGGWYYGSAEPDGRGGWRAPIARMWGGPYVHGDCRDA